MSRQAASKSRAEKGASRGGGGGGAQSVIAPPVSNDIVPGRLTEADWSKLMTEDDDCNFVASVVEDIVDVALEGCYQSYICDQVLPFTVHQAKDAILQIVQWHFLSRDVGETDISNDSGWKEDSEPEAGVIDSWAQGSVPVVVRPQSSIAPSVSMLSEDHGPVHHTNATDESVVFGTEPTATSISDEHTESTDKSAVNDAETDLKPHPPADLKTIEENDFGDDVDPSKSVKKKKPSYKRHTGRVLPPSTTDFDDKLKDQTEKKDDTRSEKSEMQLSPSQKSLIKVQAGRPPGNREVTFDERGNVVGVMKLNVQALPTHRVRVSYNIIDPEAEANAQRLTALRTGRLQRVKKRGWKSERSTDDTKSTFSYKTGAGTKLKSETASSYRTREIAMSVQHAPPGNESVMRSQRGAKGYVRERRVHGARIDPLPPLLIETIDASPGVVIQEGEQVKKGPEEKYPLGVSRVLGKTTPGSPSQQPVLRSLGDKYLYSKLRPIIDPKDVVQEVNDAERQTAFALSSTLPPLGATQTAGS